MDKEIEELIGKIGDEIDQKVKEVASLLKIEHVLNQFPKELSNGQKQRTSLARSLISKPSVVLLDDPLRNVDAKIRFEMRLELPRVLKEFNTTVIYVTQDFREAMALGDRIAVLYDGKFNDIDSAAFQAAAKPIAEKIGEIAGKDFTAKFVAAAAN